MRLLAITPGDGRDLAPWLEMLDRSAFTDLIVREPGPIVLPELRRLQVWHHSRTPGPHLGPPHLRFGEPIPDGPFGMSCHSRAELDAAFGAGATYALLSPVFPPHSKPEDRRLPLGEDTFFAWAAGRPVFALGGISGVRAHRLMARGAHGVAVLGGVFADPLASLQERLEAYPSGASNTNRVSS